MSNQEDQPSQNEEPVQAEKPKPHVLLALIEHGSRPAALVILGLFALIVLCMFSTPISKLLEGAEEVRFGSFALSLRKSAVRAGLNRELSALESLSDQQIQLFLVVSGNSKAHISYSAEEVTEDNLKKLQEVGLLSEVRMLENRELFWVVSDKGHKLRQLIFKQVVESIRGSPET